MAIKQYYSHTKLVQESSEKYSNKFQILEFSGELTRESSFQYICPIHGQMESKVYLHLKKANETGCVMCGKDLATKNATKGLDKFVEQSNLYHNFSYDYSEFVYVNNKTHGKVKCKTCNYSWLCRPDTHLASDSKRGCPNCVVRNIYTTQYYTSHSIEDHLCSLYVVKFIHKETNEMFLKIGITKHQDIKRRFRGLHGVFDITVIYQENSTFFKVFEKEQMLLQSCSKFKYVPIVKFKGHTECLSLDSLETIQSSLLVMVE